MTDVDLTYEGALDFGVMATPPRARARAPGSFAAVSALRLGIRGDRARRAALEKSTEPGGGPSDTTPPVVGSWSPVNGSTIAAANSVTVRATDNASIAAAGITVYAEFDGGRTEVVFTESAFTAAYAGGSMLTLIAGGWQVLALRAAGWPTTGLTLHVVATDDAGNRTTGSASYTVSDPTGEFDSTPPVISDWTTALTIAADNSVSVKAIDAESGIPLASVVIWALFGSGVAEAVFVNGAFTAKYAGGSSYILQPGGWVFLLVRTSGWPDASLTLAVQAFDAHGNEANASHAYTVTGTTGPDTVAPAIGNVQPPPGTPIDRAAPVFVDITDDSGAFRRVFVAALFADGAYEVVHDGDTFAPRYSALSSRSVITNGFRYRLRRTAGWETAPTLRAWAIDRSGNEGSA